MPICPLASLPGSCTPQLHHNLLAVRIAPVHNARFGVFGLQFWATLRSLGSHFGGIHFHLPHTVVALTLPA